MADRAKSGGSDRVSTKSRLAEELLILGRVLVRARESRKLKQSDIATKLGMPASYLSKIENGSRRLDAIELIHLAEAMEIDPAEIVHDLQQELAARRV